MLEFLKKITDWTLQKEEDLAKNCKLPLDELEKQIQVVQDKKAKLELECKENIAELNKILGRLESMKNIEMTKCNIK